MTLEKHNYSEPYIEIIRIGFDIITQSLGTDMGGDDIVDDDDNQLDWV